MAGFDTLRDDAACGVNAPMSNLDTGRTLRDSARGLRSYLYELLSSVSSWRV